MTKMRILVVSNYYPPQFVGGYELACRDTVAYLRERGHEICVLSSGSGSNEYSIESEQGDFGELVLRKLRFIDYQHPSFVNKHKVEKTNYRLTREALQSFSPDIVYFWNMQFISLAPIFAVQQASLPRLFEIGDLWPKAYLKPGWANWCKRQFKKRLPLAIGGTLDFGPCIAVSNWIADEIRQSYRAHSVSVIGNGTSMVKQINIDHRVSERFLFTGRVCPEKGVEVALQAFAVARKSRPSCMMSLTIVGPIEHSYRQRLIQLITSLALDSCVTLQAPSTDMASIYQYHDVLLMPTLTKEAFGLVVIEAMAHGLAVIASNTYGPAEIVEHGSLGVLVDPNNPGDIAQAIISLVDNPSQRVAMGRSAYQHVNTHYAMHVVKNKVEKKLIDTAQKGVA